MARGLIKTLGLAGAALTAWYFLDPKKGAGRRDSFVKNAKDLYDNAGDEISRLSKTAGDEISRLSKDLASGVSDTVGRATEAVQGFTSGIASNGGSATETAAQRSESAKAPAAIQ
jgi:gas vesicle protein